MTGDFDWLNDEHDVDFSGPLAEIPVVTGDKPLVSKPAKAPVVKRNRRPKELVRAERRLTLVQRFYIRLLVECDTIAAAGRRLTDAGHVFDRTTLYRWRRKPDFAEALRLSQNWKFQCLGISKELVMNAADAVRELALTPRPILHKGQATKFEEIQLASAMRAIEFMGKGIGISDSASQRVQVNIDIDFSGRVDGVDTVIEGEFAYVE